MENIYANAGNVITGNRYVNRTQAEKLIRERVLDNQASGSFALTGMQRTGKSSILHHMLLSEERKAELLKEKKIVVDNSLSGVSCADDIFMNMVRKSYRVIKKNEPAENLEDLNEAYEDLMGWCAKKDSLFEIQVYLEEMVALGYKLIVVMDEFDNAISLFEDCPHCFNYLREIAYKPQYRTDYVIASRRVLSEISNMATKGVSPFPNIFVCEFLGPYNQEEQKEYFDIFKKEYGVEIPEKEKTELIKYTGGLAFWNDIIMREYVKKMSEGVKEISIKKIYNEIEYQFWDLYGRLADLLEDQGLLNPLMQFEFGPVMTATREDRSTLCSYGIVNEKKGQYEIFAKGYKEYLSMKQSAYDFAPLWNNTERAMRRVLLRFLVNNYGEKEWHEAFKKKYSVGRAVDYEECIRRLNDKKRMMLREQVSGDVCEIDMLQTRELFRVIEDEWETMCKVFPNVNKEQWKTLKNEVSGTRNDYQHNNYHLLSEGTIAKNNANLTLILECITKWEEKNQGK